MLVAAENVNVQRPEGGPATTAGPASLRPLAPANPAAFASDSHGDIEASTLVTFRLGWQTYALPLDRVERALRMVAITGVPEAPKDVLGLIDLQGEVISVIDLRHRLGLTRRTPHLDDRLLVVRVAQRGLALAVDEVCEVLEVAASLIESPPPAVARARPIAAVIRRAEGLVLVLDPMRLAPEGEKGQESSESDQLEARTSASDDGGSSLTRIRGIGRVYAERLTAAGVRSLPELAGITAEEIVLLLGLQPGRHAEAECWIEQANELSREDESTTDDGRPAEPEAGTGDLP